MNLLYFLSSIFHLLEALQLYLITQSHWSSGPAICFPPGGAVVCVPGMHSHFWNWDSPVSDVLLHWWPQRDPWSPATIGPLCSRFSPWPQPPAGLTSLLVPVPFSLQATDYGDIPLESCRAYTHYEGRGGALWSPCISHTTTQSHWSSGSTICFPLGWAAIRILGMHPHLWNWDLLLTISRYIGDPDHRPWKVPFALGFRDGLSHCLL
jgi:hypothetical protein